MISKLNKINSNINLLKNKQGLGIISHDVQIIYRRLIDTEDGDIISYTELSELIGQNILKKRYILNSARRKAANENHIEFDTITRYGIERLSSNRIIEITGPRTLNRIRTMNEKNRTKILNTNYQKLSEENKCKKDLYITMTNFIDHTTREETIKKIKDGINSDRKKSSINSCLESIKDKMIKHKDYY